MAFLTFMLLAGLFAAGLYLYRDLTAHMSVQQVEQETANSMELRAHRLCMQAYQASLVTNGNERVRLEDEFQDDLHEYFDDYQAEVAARLKKRKVSSISAYGFIRIK